MNFYCEANESDLFLSEIVVSKWLDSTNSTAEIEMLSRMTPYSRVQVNSNLLLSKQAQSARIYGITFSDSPAT